MNKILYLVLTMSLCHVAQAAQDIEYNTSSTSIKFAPSEVNFYDEELLEDTYVFKNVDPKSPEKYLHLNKQSVMKVRGKYIFNENIKMRPILGGRYTNEKFIFDKIITVEDQKKNRGKSNVFSLNDVTSSPIAMPSDSTGTKEVQPVLRYKPYAIITRYALINDEGNIVDTFYDKSLMQFRSIAECRSAKEDYHEKALENLEKIFFIKARLLKGSVELSCTKIPKK